MLKLTEENKISEYVIGVDEVGRGPLAGPVVSAAVILNNNFDTKNLNDSKKLTKIQREKILKLIKSNSVFHIGVAEVDEIDRINILQATFLSMRRAVQKFKNIDKYKILVDGPHSFDKLNKNIIPVIKGDSIYPSIAAASIVAKCYRDDLMLKLSKDFCFYDWDKNSGYGTKNHMMALTKHGISKHHRKSFAPIYKILSQKTQ